MQEILKRLSELVALLEDAIKDNNAKLVDLSAKISKVDSKAALQEVKETELKDREAKVLPSEEVNRIKQENQELVTKAAEDLSEARRKLEAFGVYSTQKGEEIKLKITNLDGQESNLKKKENYLNQKEIELANSMKNYKDKIMAEVKEKMNQI